MQYKNDNLNKMTLPQLFKIRESQLLLNYKNSFERYSAGIRFYGCFFLETIRARFKIFLSEISVELSPPLQQWLIREKFKGNEFNFLNYFERRGSINVCKTVEKLGAKIDIRFENADVQDGFSNTTGNLILSNHQHELDTFMQSLFLQNHHWVAKSNLLNYPIFGKVLKKGDPIIFYRNDTNKGQIKQRAIEIVEKLQRNENVLIFFEGTRTFTGEIGENQKLAAFYTSKLLGEIEKIAEEKKIKIQRLLVVLKTFDSFSNIGNLDKKSFGSARSKSNLSKFKELLASTRFKKNRIALHVYGNRRFTYNYSDDEDETNIFGFFRNKVKNIVIEDIIMAQSDHKE